MKKNFLSVYDGLKVLITGHTGFKGAWLSIWLKELGADVVGYSLTPPTSPSLFSSCDLEKHITHIHGDIRDASYFNEILQKEKPEIVFHLAAQSLVLESYRHPAETFEVNVQGTVNILEAIRHCPSVKAAVVITTDKVYENKEWLWGYREGDRLGGEDPYSASKSMAEIAINAYRSSFFKNSTSIASARAGNVIGGGDFASDRLIPDTIKALSAHKSVELRNPQSIRPWMHVLDPLSGYLWLAARLYTEGNAYAEAWNFGPQETTMVSCAAMVEKTIELWGEGEWSDISQANINKEMNLLQINWEKASKRLVWRPAYSWIDALQETVDWFKAFERYNCKNDHESMYATCTDHIHTYIASAHRQNMAWTTSKKYVLQGTI